MPKIPPSFLKFGALSGGGWLLDCSLLLVLTGAAELPLRASNFVSSSVAAMTVFFVSRRWVFQSEQRNTGRKAMAYFCHTVLMISLSSLAIGAVSQGVSWCAMATSYPISPAEVSFWSKVLITPPQLLANFWVARFLSRQS